MPEDLPQSKTAALGPDADPEHAAPTPSPSAGHTAGAEALLTTLPVRLGRYVVRNLLGKGGMGAVYLADDTHLNRRVAFKVPHLAGADADTVRILRDRFLREARLAASLTHPNLCPVYDCGEIDGVLYLAMAYLEGKPLAKFIRSGQPLPPRAVVAVVRQLAIAMYEAHSRGIIHRDLKPANIMVTPTRQPVIMDFGVARRTDAEDTRLTRTGLVVGTPAYMPPEQLNCDQALIGPATDIYALGVILYELLAGRTPFQGPPGALMAQIMIDAPPPLSRWRAALDTALDGICNRALAKPPQDRFPSMLAFANALDEYLHSAVRLTVAPETAAAPPPAFAAPKPPPAPPRPAVPAPKQTAASLDEENAATLFNEMAAQQVRMGAAPRPRAVTHHRPRRRWRFQLQQLIPWAGSLVALAAGALLIWGFFVHLRDQHSPSPSAHSPPSAGQRDKPTPSTPRRVAEDSDNFDSLRAAINMLHQDAMDNRPPNAIGKQYIERWFETPPQNRPQLPADVRKEFARAVILVLRDWDRGKPYVQFDDLLWIKALELEERADTRDEGDDLVASSDAWWELADAEKRNGWPDEPLRQKADAVGRRALLRPLLFQDHERIQKRLQRKK